MRQIEIFQKWRLLFSIGIGGLIASLSIWQILMAQEKSFIKRTIETEAATIRKEINIVMEDRILALERMGKRFENRRGTPRKEWEADAMNHYSYLPGFQAIEWVDPSFHVRWVVPLKGNESALNQNLASEERNRIALEEAINKKTVTISRTIDLVMGEKGFRIYVPLFIGEKFAGFMLWVARAQELFQSILEKDVSEGYSIAIFDGDTQIFKSYDGSSKGNDEWREEFPFKIRGITWRVQVWPQSTLLANMQSHIPLVSLVVSFFITLLLMLTAYLAQSARLKANETLSLNHELENEILERTRAEKMLEEENQHTKTLASRLEIAGEIAKSASSNLEPEEQFRTIVAEIRRAIPCERCVIATCDPHMGRHRFWHVESDVEVQPYSDPEEDKKRADWFLQNLYRKTQPVNIPDLLNGHHLWATQLIKAGFRSALLVPIHQGELSLTHFALHSTRAAAFSQTQEDLLHAIASHLGPVLRNAALFQEAAERASRLEVAGEIAKSVGSILEPEELFQKVVDVVRKVVPCVECIVGTIDSKTKDIVYWGISSAIRNNPMTYKKDPEPIKWIQEIYETKEPRNIRDLQEIPIGKHSRYYDNRLRSHLSIPIVQNNQAIGHLSVLSTEVAAFSDDQVHLLTSIAGHLGSAIQNSKLHEDVTQRAEELERSNAELAQFAYVASHDLQEPLRMVTSYTELLGRRYGEKLDADAQEFIHFAVDGARRMQGLINDLLMFSRIDRKGKALEPTDCEVILDQSLKNLGMSIEESGATVTRDPLPTVMADQSQLGQLFQNLVGNAIKFRNEAPPSVHVSAKLSGNDWIFSVQDNGIGIEPEYKDRIFQIFQRLHAREEFSGTGIGLAICKKIVERHGGRIWVESEPHHGSTFSFILPALGE